MSRKAREFKFKYCVFDQDGAVIDRIITESLEEVKRFNKRLKRKLG